MEKMSRAQNLMKAISEIGYYGQHNQYSTQEYSQDAGEYLKPFSALQLPDYAGKDPQQNATSFQQQGNFYDWERKKYGASNKVR